MRAARQRRRGSSPVKLIASRAGSRARLGRTMCPFASGDGGSAAIGHLAAGAAPRAPTHCRSRPMELSSPTFRFFPRARDSRSSHLRRRRHRAAPAVAWCARRGRGLVLIVRTTPTRRSAAPRMTWVHWVLYDLPPGRDRTAGGRTSAAGGDARRAQRLGRRGLRRAMPAGRTDRISSSCMPSDKEVLPALVRPPKAAVEQAMHGHVLAQAELIGT